MPEGDEKDQMQVTEMAGEKEGGAVQHERLALAGSKMAWGCRTELDFELFS